MATADISSIIFLLPIAGFFLVFLVAYAIFTKTKLLGENQFNNIFVSFIIAIMFVSLAGAREYIQIITPWFAILAVSLVLLLAMVGFIGKPTEDMTKGIGRTFIVLMGIVFLVAAFFVFSHLFLGYLPGPQYGRNVSPSTLYFFDWLYSPSVLGTLLLIILAAAVSWVLVRKSK